MKLTDIGDKIIPRRDRKTVDAPPVAGAPAGQAAALVEQIRQLRREEAAELEAYTVKVRKARSAEDGAARAHQEATDALKALEAAHAGSENAYRHQIGAAVEELMAGRDPRIAVFLRELRQRISNIRNDAGLSIGPAIGRHRRPLAWTNLHVIREVTEVLEAAALEVDSEEFAILEGEDLARRLRDLETSLPSHIRMKDLMLWTHGDYFCALRQGDGVDGFPVRYSVDGFVVAEANATSLEDADVWAAGHYNALMAKIEERKDENARRNRKAEEQSSRRGGAYL